MTLDWLDETRDIGKGGRAVTREANETDRRKLAEALDLIACEALDFDYMIKPLSEGRYRLSGRLKASVTQACVVSLEPVPSTIGEEVSLEFWPAELLSERAIGGEHDVLGEADPEPLGQLGRIDSGRIAYEVLSAALDPYPRKAGAEFEYAGAPEDTAAKERAHPFAALARLQGEKSKE